MNRRNGYGTAGYNIVTTLQSLGHEIPFQDWSAPVQLNFCQPVYTEYGNNYNILYTPWESTGIPPDWKEIMLDADEVWATSEFVKDVYESYDINVSRVYMHGIEDIWTPKRRSPDRMIKFLHIGGPAPRKGGQMALEAFRAAFGNRRDVHLTLKGFGRTLVYADAEARSNPGRTYKNVSVNTRQMEVDELVNFIHQHDVLVYPSYGEGFGLIPIQAMATGMPTICTDAWAPYRDELLPELRLSGELVDSPWPSIHPGKMFEPSFDHLVELYKYSADNLKSIQKRAFDLAPVVHEKFDWERLTSEAFENVIKEFG